MQGSPIFAWVVSLFLVLFWIDRNAIAQAGLACNCDSGESSWQEDGGNITEPRHLPVAALHFGDTGTPFDQKEGR